jgi:hypothetical protein
MKSINSYTPEWIEKVTNPEKYLKPNESPCCECGHHALNHSYVAGYDLLLQEDRSKDIFCFYNYGKMDYRDEASQIKYPHCPCRGFKSRMKEEKT